MNYHHLSITVFLAATFTLPLGVPITYAAETPQAAIAAPAPVQPSEEEIVQSVPLELRAELRTAIKQAKADQSTKRVIVASCEAQQTPTFEQFSQIALDESLSYGITPNFLMWFLPAVFILVVIIVALVIIYVVWKISQLLNRPPPNNNPPGNENPAFVQRPLKTASFDLVDDPRPSLVITNDIAPGMTVEATPDLQTPAWHPLISFEISQMTMVTNSLNTDYYFACFITATTNGVYMDRRLLSGGANGVGLMTTAPYYLDVPAAKQEYYRSYH